jgi:hypothetical protein
MNRDALVPTTKSALFLLLCAALALVSGCNLITGADGVTFEDDEEADATGSEGAGGTVNPGPASGSGSESGSGAAGAGGDTGTGASGATGGTGGSGAAGGGTPTDLAPADGISMSRIVLYQGVERPLMADGSPASAVAPVVENRAALIRVFYTTDTSFNGGPVTARLSLSSGAPIEVQTVPSGSSSAGSLSSTINFDVDRTLMDAGTTYRVELLQPGGSGTNPGAVYPAQGQADLEVESGGMLKLTVVPIQYNGDGSGRMPDTSATQLQLIEDAFYAVYPITSIQLSLRAAVAYPNAVGSDGSGWSAMLNAFADLRANDNAAADEYYFGVFQPASSHSAFCGGQACIGGLGFTAPASSSYHRAAIGLGYSGNTYVEIALHEVGHLHGRGHAPCNTNGSDTNFPYPNGALGGWGYDLLSGSLVSPSNHKDLMGYCKPRWISDYNFGNLFDRIALLNSSDVYTPPSLQNLTWDRVVIGPDGTATPAGSIQLAQPPFGEEVEVTVGTDSGTTTLTGQFVPYDHVEGGLLFVPPTSNGPKLIHTELAGLPLEVWLP